MGKFWIYKTSQYLEWFELQSDKDRSLIDSRIVRIIENEHFGDYKDLNKGLYELRWKNGRRLYFARFKDRIILLLIGGLKNAQKKDIKKARRLLEQYDRTGV